MDGGGELRHSRCGHLGLLFATNVERLRDYGNEKHEIRV
jgi:hypothetical protein